MRQSSYRQRRKASFLTYPLRKCSKQEEDLSRRGEKEKKGEENFLLALLKKISDCIFLKIVVYSLVNMVKESILGKQQWHSFFSKSIKLVSYRSFTATHIVYY